jgi:hypothetical protein
MRRHDDISEKLRAAFVNEKFPTINYDVDRSRSDKDGLPPNDGVGNEIDLLLFSSPMLFHDSLPRLLYCSIMAWPWSVVLVIWNNKVQLRLGRGFFRPSK